jgi:hypothetical protein
MNNFYKEKYLKYKIKYLGLKSLLGGSKQTAKKFYFTQLRKKYPQIYNIFTSDVFLGDLINLNNLPLPINMQNINLEDEEKNEDSIFNQIFNLITNDIDDKNYDLFCKLYIEGVLGSTNSLENKGRFVQSINKYYKIPIQYRDLKPENITSLEHLEKYIDDKTEILEQVDKKSEDKLKKKQIELEIKQKGENDKEIIFSSDKVIIYKPTTMAGSKYFGRNTKWCTASYDDNLNMFNYYNSMGPLYILNSLIYKDKFGFLKFQMHINSRQLMDSNDNEVSLNYVKERLGDSEFNTFIDELIDSTISQSNIINDEEFELDTLFSVELFRKYIEYHKIPNLNAVVVDTDIQLNNYFSNIDGIEKIKKLIFANGLNESLGNSLDNLIGLEILGFRSDFNQPLGNSLKNLVNLEIIILSYDFNQPLGNSLNNLTSLKKLHFGSNFNQDLGESLKNLVNLETLIFGHNFNQPLGNSLDNLTSLIILQFGNIFDQPLDNSLDNLTSLIDLRFGNNFNQDLGESLKNLVNLEKLIFGYDFNKPLGNSLDNLTSLIDLRFGNNFNRDLGESLKNLINLEYLFFGYMFDKKFNNSLSTLTNLVELVVDNFYYDQKLAGSLNNLDNLEKITLPEKYYDEVERIDSSIIFTPNDIDINNDIDNYDDNYDNYNYGNDY